MKKFMTRSAAVLALTIALVGCSSGNDTTEAPETTSAVEETTTVAETTTEETTVEESEAATGETETVDYAALKAEMEDKGEGLYSKTNEDGSVTYLKELAMDDHGWAPMGTLTVDKDGNITESSFDYVNAEGKHKSEDQEYIEAMKKGSETGKDISEAIAFYSNYLKTSTDLEAIPADVITGATHTAENYKTVASELLKAANIAE